MSSTLRRTGGLVVVAVLLAGCGGIHPGLAAQIDDTKITASRVDKLAGDYCSAIEPQLGSGQQNVPDAISLSSLRSGVLGLLATKAVVEEVATAYDVDPGSDYQTAISSATKNAEGLPAKLRAGYVELQTGSAYIQGVLTAAAKKDLSAAGNDKPTSAQIQTQGKKIFDKYLAAADVSVDPRYGLGDDLTAKDGALSFSVSAAAKAADNAGTDDASYAKGLPASLRCGK